VSIVDRNVLNLDINIIALNDLLTGYSLKMNSTNLYNSEKGHVLSPPEWEHTKRTRFRRLVGF